MKFIVYTRFGLYVDSDEWYSEQLNVIQRFALQSLAEQSDQEFYWLIGIDERAPEPVILSLREKIEHRLGGRAFIVVYKREEKGRFPKSGSTEWLFEEALDKIGRDKLFDSVDEYYISAMIDADDAWHTDTVKKVKSIFSEKYCAITHMETTAAYLTSPSSGAVLTFVNGIDYYEQTGEFAFRESPFMSMSVFVMARVYSSLSCHSSRHKSWKDYSRVVGFDEIIYSTEVPMWLYSMSKNPGKEDCSDGDSLIRQDLFKSFGLRESDFKNECVDMNFDSHFNPNESQRNFFTSRFKYLSNIS